MLNVYQGCGDGDIDASEKIVNEMLERYPEVMYSAIISLICQFDLRNF